MLNDRLNAARKIAAELIPLEQDLEATFIKATRLSAAIVEGRQSARMPITAGQDSLTQLAAATGLLLEVRARIAAAHASLAEERLSAGLRTFAIGDVDECPPLPAGRIALVVDTATA